MNNNHTNILLIDDDRLVLSTLRTGLTRANYSVSTADSVDEAEAILASGERPNLIILDVKMPKKSGMVLAERLHSFDHIPFIMLTAYCDQEFVNQASAFGALGYLVKPIDTAKLIPAIEAALARSKDIQELQLNDQRLQKALDSEREISIAIGITMVQHHLERKAAFEFLRKNARNQRCKLSELALEVIRACTITNSTGC